jgi:hypothetical protein
MGYLIIFCDILCYGKAFANYKFKIILGGSFMHLNKRNVFLMTVCAGILICLPPVWAQVEQLEGDWNLETDIEGGEQSIVTISNNGNTVFSETYPYIVGETEYIFDVGHTGRFTALADGQLLYTGVGNGEALDANGDITVKLAVTGSGMISDDANMVVGVWKNLETYTTPDGVINDSDGKSFILTRDGFDPGTPGQALAGLWEITLIGANIDWTGQVTMNPDGTLMGNYAPTGSSTTQMLALAGLFSYSQEKEFDFTLTGTGQGNDDNTHIEGTWEFTVDVSNLVSKTFSGTYEMTKLEDAGLDNWDLFE